MLYASTRKRTLCCLMAQAMRDGWKRCPCHVSNRLIPRRYLPRLISRTTSGPTHNHGPTGDHSHAGTAFITWLDFYQAAQQAEAIKQALSKQLPAHARRLRANYQALHRDLMQLDLDMQRTVASKPDQTFFASHPSTITLQGGTNCTSRTCSGSPTVCRMTASGSSYAIVARISLPTGCSGNNGQ